MSPYKPLDIHVPEPLSVEQQLRGMPSQYELIAAIRKRYPDTHISRIRDLHYLGRQYNAWYVWLVYLDEHMPEARICWIFYRDDFEYELRGAPPNLERVRMQ